MRTMIFFEFVHLINIYKIVNQFSKVSEILTNIEIIIKTSNGKNYFNHSKFFYQSSNNNR